MDWPSQTAAVIPCLNEQATIGPLVQAVRPYVTSVVVVDDGSIDETSARAQAAGAEVLRHRRPKGKGAALQSGWRRCREFGLTWALTLDGDGQHSPEDIPKFFQCAEQTGAALFIGNRMAESQPMPWIRRLVNRRLSQMLSKAARQFFPDSQCGFRLLELAALGRLPISAAHFEIESEVLLLSARAGHKIEFVPVRVHYAAERSKISPIRDTIRWLKWWRKMRRPGSGG
jgi:glycosyltransferase involved in cell wall biosynthesis